MKKWISLVCLLLALGNGICVAGLSVRAEEKSSETIYYSYYLNKDATQLEKMEYKPESEDRDAILKDLVVRIGSKNPEEKTISLLPQEVNINSWNLDGQILTIDFNSQYSKMSRTREVLVRAGIVRTLVQIPGVEAVRFTVIGDDLTDSKQQAIGVMTADSFVEYSATQDQSSYRQEILTLYFTDAEGTGLVEEKRKVFYKPSLQKEKVVLEQLIKGPMEKGNYPTLPDNISVLSISTSDEIYYVSLTQSFIDSALPINEELAIYSIVNSLIASCGPGRVELLIEGNTDFVLGSGMSLYQFFEKNEELILPVEMQKEDTAS